MTEPVRVGVMGTAAIARRRMLPAMAASAATEIVAVASRDEAKATEVARSYGCRAVEGYEALLAREDVEAVYVPLPAALHATWNEAALRAGKHVLAEKPLTTDVSRTRTLLDLARERDLVLMENVMFVHHTQHARVRSLVGQGAVGEPRAFHAAFTVPRMPDGDIRHRPELGGGALSDTGVYPVRAAMELLGPELEVAGAVLTPSGGQRVETAGAALLRDLNGVSAQLTFGMDHHYRSRYEVWGSEGRITVDRAFTPPADHAPVLRIDRGADTEHLRLPAEDQVAGTLAAFAAAVRGQRTCDDASVLRQAELLDAVRREAARTDPAQTQEEN